MPRRLLLIGSLFAAPVALGALNARSIISVNGSDSNSCASTAPCRSLAVAVTHTAAGGEIIAINTAGYGAATVDRALTVSGAPGVHAAITTAANGITVNASSTDNVTIRNLVFIGPPTTMGLSEGVFVLLAGEVRVIGCLIRGFPSAGIGTVQGNLTIEDCMIIDNIGFGVDVENNAPASGTVRATISNSLLQGNNGGVYVGQGTDVVVKDTIVSHGDDAIHVESLGGVGTFGARLMLERSFITHNLNAGVFLTADGANTSKAYISDTLFEDNNQPVVAFAGNSIPYTFGNNQFVNNTFPPDPMTPIGAQ